MIFGKPLVYAIWHFGDGMAALTPGKPEPCWRRPPQTQYKKPLISF
jgi:hypothetical protein